MRYYRIMHIISKTSVWIFLFSFLFSIQRLIIKLIVDVDNFVLFNTIYIHELLLAITSVLLIKKFIYISSPFEKYIHKT